MPQSQKVKSGTGPRHRAAHADEEAREDGLTREEVYDSVIRGEIIEDYADDEPHPSCLIYGTIKGKPVHSVWSYNAKNKSTVLVTVYRPDPKQWINWKERRKAK
ncbi:MAG: hypothetical protein A3G34_16965 [Candidatus Lindowbacteria bacterium RIFCSPLOWO2_12_FULL_62_27]|nr:MAG: hypothetical protein A3G34_16965 [Candidatus Lindowbacteria bacterium RIFCSPLOWO2_12_FULL_62_27]OGH63951.1 MAG: hypothetical protein A3I06_10320 [Candidatus Lindowbacteria bacterium RIFCSPLOWO2_02_FULL_62_12]